MTLDGKAILVTGALYVPRSLALTPARRGRARP
jgi:hypothetical protein